MESETTYRPAVHTHLDPGVRTGIEAAIGAPIVYLVITVEDACGRVIVVTPDEQSPAVSHVLAERTVDRLS